MGNVEYRVMSEHLLLFGVLMSSLKKEVVNLYQELQPIFGCLQTHNFRSLAFCLPTFCITAEKMEQLSREGEQAQAISFLGLENCTGYCLFHQGRHLLPLLQLWDTREQGAQSSCVCRADSCESRVVTQGWGVSPEQENSSSIAKSQGFS